MLPNQHKKEIEQALGIADNAPLKAEFYNHKVIDSDATFGKAMELAIEDAHKRTQEKQIPWLNAIESAKAKGLPTEHLYSKLVEAEILPDFSPESLKGFGGKNVYKNVVYVKIKKVGVEDYCSRVATEQHKQHFAEAWAKFEAENDNIREERQEVQVGESGQQHNPQGGNWTGGISFTPSQYTTTFG